MDSNMVDLAGQLERCAAEQAAAIRTIHAYRAHFGQDIGTADMTTWGLPPEALEQIRHARDCIVTTAARMQVLTTTPVDFLQRLASENQVLACLRWLCEFQVLACIPLDEVVRFVDVAFLASVPEDQFRRVARMMATVGFLCEPRSEHVAHTSMSAAFVSESGLFDAAQFLSTTMAPAALNMAEATRRSIDPEIPDETPYRLAFPASDPFPELYQRRPRLQAQWPTYLEYGTRNDENAVKDVLMMVDWNALGQATVVDVGAQSLVASVALAENFPLLQFVVQPNECSTWPSTTSSLEADMKSRVTVQQRLRGSMQFITDAAVYILRLPAPSPTTPMQNIASQAAVELSAHMDVLRTNPASRVVLLMRILPGPGTVDARSEASARVRDLSLFQLANGREAEASEVHEVLDAVRDNEGRLVLTGELRSPKSAMVAFEIRYQTHTDRQRSYSSFGWPNG